MDYRIRKIKESEYSVLPVFLYEAIFIPEGTEKPSKSVLENYDDYIITAEGNVENVSRILERKKNSRIRAYIRIPDNFLY